MNNLSDSHFKYTVNSTCLSGNFGWFCTGSFYLKLHVLYIHDDKYVAIQIRILVNHEKGYYVPFVNSLDQKCHFEGCFVIVHVPLRKSLAGDYDKDLWYF